jgi:putative nucleotidyltransferase with HDIG domain
MYLYKFRKSIYNNNGRLLIISIILCINAIFAAGSNIISGYLIPTGFIVILMSMIFDPLMGFIVSIPSAVIVACTTNFNFEAVLIYIIGSLAGILFSYNVHQRHNIFLSGFILGILDGIIIFSIGLVNNNALVPSLINSSIGVAGGILSAILAIGILPVFEQMFDIITPIKLLELSNPNQPLLKKMLFEAPGTYHHSILVGNLAEAAANEVGANALLTRTGAYYHDIGKIKRPYFFKENQITNDNPHDKITPKLSTLIITSHVKDGMELAEEYKLPKAIKDIIEQHHGTTLVRYFYVMAMNNESEIVEEASFRYDGPKPFAKETAIVMLADSVEAAVRSLGNPTTMDIEKMVNKIVEEKVNDGQLDDCDLTLKDIEKIKQVFLKVLEGIFHSRIEYPEVNTQIKEGMSASDRV